MTMNLKKQAHKSRKLITCLKSLLNLYKHSAVNSAGKNGGREPTGPDVVERVSEEQSQNIDEHQRTSTPQSERTLEDDHTSSSETESCHSRDSQDAQTQGSSMQARARQRYTNFIHRDPEVLGLAYRVTNLEKISASAKSWTSSESHCIDKTMTEEKCIVIRYLHGEEVPAPVAPPGGSEAFLHIRCCRENDFKSRHVVEVPVRLLMMFSPALNGFDIFSNASQLFGAVHGTFVGTIDVGRIDKGVVESAVTFLKGGVLEVRLPALGEHISYGEKKALLQTADLAHKLDIICLQKAAMHAICVSVLREQTDWDNEETRLLLQ
ncbi:hypothetical protein G647_03204 [Cladophialophora carrionii CBS 160.54]|uniref:Uncharacterized protein n=1 Tax=Cladophialophora carrionii CBS 160.54 TaxID=1279043 RepID=V9DKH0_9EURO|nr:uncharacterized protein G647_03204 [Cladophialophora carrionii CBS 160.54]ETI26427.1 hypothetical protein G647_03204 [Cladophialophora carrionii CBS 160.54]